MNPVIYHNPRCSKSRATLALLQERGIEPQIVLYLQDTLDKSTLRTLLGLLNISPRELMRTAEPQYRAQGLDDPELSDDELLDALHRFPKLIERPIVVANGKARIGRPPESVIDIL